jgi:hypothetical protein
VDAAKIHFALIGPLVDNSAIVAAACVIVGAFNHGAQMGGIECAREEGNGLLRLFAGAIYGDLLQILARVKAEDGRETLHFAVGLRFVHAFVQLAADLSRPQLFEVQV